ncbi:MAG: cupin domain-containing protein [Clostridia bacterium]|nr:cupin domain-containing protein [Clostridia bacterium]
MITRLNEQKTTLKEHMRGGNKCVELRGLVNELPQNSRLFSRITLVPGASIGYHVHENETELFYFIEGSGLVNDDGNTFEVSAGDAMSTSSGHGHAVENNSDGDLVIVAVIIKDSAV